MKKVLIVAVLAGAAIALAQDRTQAVPEAGVDWDALVITKPVPDDGGCLFRVIGNNDAGLIPPNTTYSFNGARCATVRSAGLTAAKKDLNVGTGALP